MNRWATLDQSDFSLDSQQLAAVTGSVFFDVPEGGTVGSIFTSGFDTVNGKSQYSGVSSVKWSVGEESGTMTAASDVSLAEGALWDVTGDLLYGSNVYYFNAQDSTAAFVCQGKGGYGGASIYEWYDQMRCCIFSQWLFLVITAANPNETLFFNRWCE